MANVARAKKVSATDFITGYVKGCSEGLTSSEIADLLNMNEASMISRASGYRTESAEIGKVFPSPKGSNSVVNSKKSRIDLLTSLLTDLDTDETAETETGETDESVE